MTGAEHRRFRALFISDVHLEFLGSKAPDIPQHAPVLAIVGDLGTLTACYLSVVLTALFR